MGDDAPRTLYLVLLLVLVLASVLSMRLPIGKALKMAAAWAGIFGLAFILFAFRDDFSALGQRLKAEATGTPISDGQQIRIPISEDGHFWVDATINGESAPFLVDSGASITTISRQTADKIGIGKNDDREVAYTANGAVQMQRAVASSLNVAGIERSDFAIRVNDNDDTNVIGMNFLSSLASWRVEGNYLILRP
jgi:aspartyl protease family protein